MALLPITLNCRRFRLKDCKQTGDSFPLPLLKRQNRSPFLTIHQNHHHKISKLPFTSQIIPQMESSETSDQLSSTALLSLFIIISYMITCSGARLDPLAEEAEMDFIKTSCGVTLYPDLCFQSLSPHASTVHMSYTRLAQVALAVSLTSARSTSDMVVSMSKETDMSPRETAAVADCVETIGDSIDELQQSFEEMKHLGGPDFDLKLSNMQTWVSAALTNEDTCMDGFAGDAMNGNIKNTIRKGIVSVAQLTSNALALINNLSSTQPNEP